MKINIHSRLKKLLKNKKLSIQEYRTLKGIAITGDFKAVEKGMKKIRERRI